MNSYARQVATVARFAILALAIANSAGCASVRSASADLPQSGYQCAYEERGAFGVVSSNFEIRSPGETGGGYVQWDAGTTSTNPMISGAWFRHAVPGFSLDYGYVSIMRHIWEKRAAGKRPRPLELSLALSATNAPGMNTSRLATEFQRSGGPFHIQINWRDAAAMAQGAARLYLVARNRRADVVDEVELDRTMFERAEPHIAAAFDAVERMIADPARHCTYVEALRQDGIIAT
jgi:hypothetical protein